MFRQDGHTADDSPVINGQVNRPKFICVGGSGELLADFYCACQFFLDLAFQCFLWCFVLFDFSTWELPFTGEYFRWTTLCTENFSLLYNDGTDNWDGFHEWPPDTL